MRDHWGHPSAALRYRQTILQTNNRPGNLADLELNVETAGEPTPGTYTMTPISNTVTAVLGDGGAAPMTSGINFPYAYASFGQTDASCMTTTYNTESSGSITLTTVSSTEVAGSFDVTYPSGDHLTGSFDAPVCTVPSGGPSGPMTCGG